MRIGTQNRKEYNKQSQDWGSPWKKKWKNKVMRGQYIRNIDRLLVKKTRSSGYRRETWKQNLKVK